MENNGLRFYQIFSFGGAIGVNSLTLGELLAVNFMTLVFIIVLLGILASILPIVLFFAYLFLAMAGNWEQMQIDRLRVNIFSIVGYIYFMIDYHYGFIGWSFFNTFFGSQFVDKLCYLNTGLFLFNIFLLFFGNSILSQLNYGIGRLITFLALSFIGYKVLIPIGSVLSPAIAKQHVPKPGDEIIKNSDDVHEEPYNGGSLEEEMEKFERGRSNYNYESTPNVTEPDEISDEVENYGC